MSPEHDLRWWLVSPSTHESALDFDYIQEKRFTYQHLRDAVVSALSDLDTVHKDLEGLLVYAKRDPYQLRLPSLAHKANPKLLELEAKDYAAVDRDVLERELETMAIELDYMRHECYKVKQFVTRKKFALAENGDWAEIEALFRMGYVDEVEKICA